MSPLRRAIFEYLELRRSLGFELERYENVLNDFADFARRDGREFVTRESALRWALRPPDHHPAWRAARLSILRGFAKHRSGSDSRTELLPQRLLPHRRERKPPHLYTVEEVCRLIRAARSLSKKRDLLRPSTYSTLLGLLSCTGLRISEAISMDREDFDDKANVLTIRLTKFKKSRLVPIHPSTGRVLTRYLRQRERQAGNHSPSFFLSGARKRLIPQVVQRTFRALTRQARVNPLPERRSPRLHDFRHSFAIRTVLRWYRREQDAEALLPRLSTYLGHARVSDTYWYLSSNPELLAFAALRLERAFGRHT